MVSQIRVLLVGNGGREHALAWKLSQSQNVQQIYVCPGNGGTATLAKTKNVSSVSAIDFGGLVKFAFEQNIDLLIPGPEAPLVDGITDYFAEHAKSIQCFGPSKIAAVMEGSKAFSKDFMERHNIPTAKYANFTAYEKALQYLTSFPDPPNVVLKADGLAAGKGVIIPLSQLEAQAGLKEIMLDRQFGDAGNEVVIEECLVGHEISILSFCDGSTIKSLPPAQDHKRIRNGDRGPNTGGMGTYAPAPESIVTKQMLDDIDRTILEPSIQGMKREGFPFVGCLFTGLMITKDGPKVLEYNVRFGDPETQSLLPLLDTDLAEIMLACTSGRLADLDFKIFSKSAATVVLAAGGYPGSYKKGIPIALKTTPEHVIVFHAGTEIAKDGTLVTSGGRVIASTAVADTLDAAVKKAYEGVDCIDFEGRQYRTDIGARALQ